MTVTGPRTPATCWKSTSTLSIRWSPRTPPSPPGAPLLYPDWPDNVVIDFPVDNPDANAEFEGRMAVSGRYEVGRHTGVPMETRGVVAEFREGRLTVWSSTQFPHIARTMLSYCLPLDENDIRVIVPDVGGGFGVKAEFYPEEVTIPWLAMRLGRPVRWIEDRREHLLATCHARDLVLDLEAAVDEDGRFRAVRGMAIQDLGAAEMYPFGYSPAFTAIGHITGPYRIPHQSVGLVAVATSKTPCGAYRGFGIPEATFAIERLMDKAADRLGIGRNEIRRRNLIGQDDNPVHNLGRGDRRLGKPPGSFRGDGARHRRAGGALAGRAGGRPRPPGRVGRRQLHRGRHAHLLHDHRTLDRLRLLLGAGEPRRDRGGVGGGLHLRPGSGVHADHVSPPKPSASAGIRSGW